MPFNNVLQRDDWVVAVHFVAKCNGKYNMYVYIMCMMSIAVERVLHVHMCAHECVCTHIHTVHSYIIHTYMTYILIHTYMFTYIHVCTYMWSMYVYTYMYVCMWSMYDMSHVCMCSTYVHECHVCSTWLQTWSSHVHTYVMSEALSCMLSCMLSCTGNLPVRSIIFEASHVLYVYSTLTTIFSKRIPY